MLFKYVMTSYELSRQWFDFAFENPSKINPNHGSLYFFCIEHCNRLGWKKEFGLPTTMAKEAIGIRSYNTYKNTLEDLVNWGFLIMVERSKNQFSSNIVALSKFDKALDKALDKAMIKHVTKQSESTGESISSINKHITNKHLTSNVKNESDYSNTHLNKNISNDKGENSERPTDFLKVGQAKDRAHMALRTPFPKLNDIGYNNLVNDFYNYAEGTAKIWVNQRETQAHFVRWASLRKWEEIKQPAERVVFEPMPET